jgi:glycosyltransferase involved in cell wall biosynthesis
MSISIIIPVYNGSQFIKKAYYSIIAQGIEDIEILFIDNNSADNSKEKILELKQIDARIKLFDQPVQGAAAARNMGLQHANGNYVYMLDVDDQIYSGAILAMKNVLDTFLEVDAVFGKMIKSHADINKTEKPETETNEVRIFERPYWGLKWFSDLKTVVGPPAFLYRKSVFEKIGFYELNIPASEDTALDIKLGMLCNVAFIDRYVYLYFKHETATTHIIKKNTDRSFMQWPRFTKSHLPFYLEHNVPKEFKKILFKGIYRSMGRMLNLTAGFKERDLLKKKLLIEITPLKTPWIIKKYLDFLVIFNFPYVYKFFIYYLIPKLLPVIIKMNDRQLKKV